MVLCGSEMWMAADWLLIAAGNRFCYEVGIFNLR